MLFVLDFGDFMVVVLSGITFAHFGGASGGGTLTFYKVFPRRHLNEDSCGNAADQMHRVIVTKATALAEFLFALAILYWDEVGASRLDLSR